MPFYLLASGSAFPSPNVGADRPGLIDQGFYPHAPASRPIIKTELPGGIACRSPAMPTGAIFLPHFTPSFFTRRNVYQLDHSVYVCRTKYYCNYACVCVYGVTYFGCEVRGFGECVWIHLATKRLHCRIWSECGCDVCWVAHGNSEVVLQVFSLVRVELDGRTTSHSMPNGVLCRDSKG